MDDRYGVTGAPVDNAKSEGQALLERLLDIDRRMAGIRDQLVKVATAIGLDTSLPERRAARDVTMTQFLPGLRLIVDSINKTLGELDITVGELEKGF